MKRQARPGPVRRSYQSLYGARPEEPNVASLQLGLVAAMNQVLDGAHMPSGRANGASVSLSAATAWGLRFAPSSLVEAAGLARIAACCLTYSRLGSLSDDRSMVDNRPRAVAHARRPVHPIAVILALAYSDNRLQAKCTPPRVAAFGPSSCAGPALGSWCRPGCIADPLQRHVAEAFQLLLNPVLTRPFHRQRTRSRCSRTTTAGLAT